MANEFVDCLVVLEKHDVCDKELAVSSLVFKCIKEHKQDYVSHFTSVFNVNGLYYYVSVVRIRNVDSVEKFIGEKGRSDNMNTAVFDSIVSDINQKADRLGQEGGMIMYAVSNVGPTIVRFGSKSFKSSSHEVLDDNTIVHLEAAYIGAERIEQNPSNYVVLPGMLLNDFLRLTITLDPGPFDDSNEFFLESLHITLIERTMFQSIEQGFPIRLCNPAIRQTPLDEKHSVHSIEALSTGSSILANAIIQSPSSEEERLGFTKALLSRGRAAISDLNWAFSSEAVLLCEVLPQAEFESHQILNPHYLYGAYLCI
ncbi:hypothetical protein CXQ85_001615 [Candidozyma haemuli]|uniref:Uncharacterized protein n=1 Tax=Candidozyma haemuli TaxID=45357 RepID=A0A2V1AN47_9ASCO|nr:hypothetical protein CXQ85_001615 [[Candida] haemuloni]PVH19309.1 hypothetical protein CXQ85_001615 [[Candida] haemuloni]